MFFAALGAKNAIDRIRSTPRGFVVVPHLHLAK
jgi:hypothetical protein